MESGNGMGYYSVSVFFDNLRRTDGTDELPGDCQNPGARPRGRKTSSPSEPNARIRNARPRGTTRDRSDIYIGSVRIGSTRGGDEAQTPATRLTPRPDEGPKGRKGAGTGSTDREPRTGNQVRGQIGASDQSNERM